MKTLPLTFARCALLVAVASLCGCASAPMERYAPTLGADVARIKFIDMGSPTRALLSASGVCKDRREARTWGWVEVPANKRLHAQFGVIGKGSNCSVAFSFVPKAGESYVADYSRPMFNCKVELSRLAAGDVKEPLGPDAMKRESGC